MLPHEFKTGLYLVSKTKRKRKRQTDRQAHRLRQKDEVRRLLKESKNTIKEKKG